jgi:PAS domain S-box-containing protein
MLDGEVINTTIDRSAHTVAVVDDNAATRYATARVLRAAGFQVTEAASGAEGLRLCEEGASAVVLDVHLPDIDGFEVCRQLRARPATSLMPIVHLSAEFVRSEDRVTGLNAGADAYLVHPVEPAVLVATLQALIRARTAEERMRRSELRFRTVYDHALNGIVLVDEKGVVNDANPAMLSLLRMRRDELVGRRLEEIAPAERRDEVRELVVAPSGQPWKGELPLVSAIGEPVHLQWSVSPHVETGLRIAIATDISERVQLEQRRRELLEREQAARILAERHSRTKDDFIAVLSHELRTPLNAIAGWVAVLLRRNPPPESIRGLQAIDRNVRTQARIISDILDVSRINSGKLRLEFEQTNPAELIADSLAALRDEIRAKDITVEADLESASAPAWLDPARYQQVFWNLMTNAVKFSSQGGTVRVRLKRSGDWLELAVQDQGQGIDPAFLPKLFDRFSQSAEPGNRRHGGLGLGLSIVQHLAELHDGTVAADSAGLGQGATVTVRIPVHQRSTSSSPAAPAPDHADSGEPLRGLDVLVVDDDPDAREMLTMVLSDRGAQVRTAADCESALDLLARHWPHLLVSDIGLPGRDGYELIREVRRTEDRERTRGRLPAIALTAFARSEDAAKAIGAGFDAHIGKPIKPHLLVSEILELIAARPAAPLTPP